ncbi:MAG: hypothetical protein FWH20_01670 [Oscillospiraceae bacterium]|nr:hypothetical protein [Oscillospiraceae bacterium]
MSRETDVIMQSVLLILNRSKSLEEAIIAIEGMCNKENIDAVNAALVKIAENEKNY